MRYSTLLSLALAGLAAAAPASDLEKRQRGGHGPGGGHWPPQDGQNGQNEQNEQNGETNPQNPGNPNPNPGNTPGSFDCSNPVEGLEKAECDWMSQIGMLGQGKNDHSNNGHIWIGEDGPNTFRFKNTAGTAMALIFWSGAKGDYESSFMDKRLPDVSYSLPANGEVVVSVAAAVSGAFSSLHTGQTRLSPATVQNPAGGQVMNTWGEFTSGNGGAGSATINVSRERTMNGNNVSIQVGDCKADMEWCSFHCKNGLTECGASGSYDLLKCTKQDQPHAGTGSYDGINPDGGCYGWDNGGVLNVNLG